MWGSILLSYPIIITLTRLFVFVTDQLSLKKKKVQCITWPPGGAAAQQFAFTWPARLTRQTTDSLVSSLIPRSVVRVEEIQLEMTIIVICLLVFFQHKEHKSRRTITAACVTSRTNSRHDQTHIQQPPAIRHRVLGLQIRMHWHRCRTNAANFNDTLRTTWGMRSFLSNPRQCDTQTRANTDDPPLSARYSIKSLKQGTSLYDSQNDSMPLVILVIRYIKRWWNLNNDLEEKRHKKHLKNDHLPEYSFPKLQRVGEG